jgi:hypothetical protein
MEIEPKILGQVRGLDERDVLQAIGVALLQLKNEDRMTLKDLGKVLGRSDDSAALYIAGESEMGVMSFLLAQAKWGDRFTDKLNEQLGRIA